MYDNKKIAIGAGLLLLAVVALGNDNEPIINDATGAWTRHATKRYGTRSLNQIQRIVVHHSASQTWTGADMAAYHVNSREWPGIGYHFVIEKDGGIFQGNKLETISYNVANGNTPTVAICLSGNFDIEQPTAQQMASLSQMVDYLRKTIPNQLPVMAHGDLQATACCGTNLKSQLYKFN